MAYSAVWPHPGDTGLNLVAGLTVIIAKGIIAKGLNPFLVGWPMTVDAPYLAMSYRVLIERRYIF